MEAVFAFMQFAGGAFFVAAWAASAIWTARDAGRRCTDPSLRLASTLGAVLVPLVGAGIYALARPCEDRLDARARRLRARMLEASLAPAGRCPRCSFGLEPDFHCCPRCGEHVRDECAGCGRSLPAAWTACPWCAAQVDRRGVPERRVA